MVQRGSGNLAGGSHGLLSTRSIHRDDCQEFQKIQYLFQRVALEYLSKKNPKFLLIRILGA